MSAMSPKHKSFGNKVEAPTNILAYWPVFIAALGSLIWFVRLESTVSFNQKTNEEKQKSLKVEINELREAEKEKDKALWLKIETLQQTLNQVLIEIGKIHGRNERD